MIISYYGLGFVKIQAGDLVIACNPTSKLPNRKTAKFGSHITLVSLNDADHNDTNLVSRGAEPPFVIDGPGEYEVRGIFVRGFAAAAGNTIYLLLVDGVRLVHLGALSASDLGAEIKEALGAIDVLFVPIGGVLDYKRAAQLARELESNLVVPIHYPDDKTLAAFLTEMGNSVKESVESLGVKKKDLADKTGEVVVIRS
jgi:hypothetical protein